ncbi:MAG: hypothetical protein ACLFWB_04130 [Armatimonadota bacterium]
MGETLSRAIFIIFVATAGATVPGPAAHAAPYVVFDIGCSPVTIENTDGVVFTVMANDRVIFQERFDRARWKPCVVDLDDLAGERATFRFSTAAYREPSQYSQGFFGQPRICAGPVEGYDCGRVIYDFIEHFDNATKGIVSPEGALKTELPGGAAATIVTPPVIEKAQKSLYLHPKWLGPQWPTAAEFSVDIPTVTSDADSPAEVTPAAFDCPTVLSHGADASHPDCTTDPDLPYDPLEVALPEDRDTGYAFSGLLAAGVETLDVNLRISGADPDGPDAFAGVVLDFLRPHGLAKRIYMGRFDGDEARLDWTNPDFTWPGYIPEYEHTGTVLQRIAAEAGDHAIDLTELAPPDWDGRVWVSAGVQNIAGASVSLSAGVQPATAEDFLVQELGETGASWTVSLYDGHICWSKQGDRTFIDECWDRYKQHIAGETLFAAEYGDRVTETEDGTHTCTPTGLRDITIHKTYSLRDGCLVKKVAFENTGETDTVIKHYSSTHLAPDFRNGGTYWRTVHQNVLGLTMAKADNVTASVRAASPEGRPDEAMVAVESDAMTAGSFRYRVNEQWVTPTTSFNWEPTLRYEPGGWSFGSGALWLRPGETKSVEVRSMITQGGWPEFLRAYQALPEVAEGWDFDTPEWVSDVYVDASPIRKWGFFDLPSGRLATNILWNIPMAWGDYFAEGTIDYGGGETNTTASIAAYLQQVHRDAPEENISLYTLLLGLEEDTETYRQHPGFAVTARHGGPDFLGPMGRHKSPGLVKQVSTDDAAEYFAAQYGDMVDGYELDFVYIDGSPAGASRIDWEKKLVTQSSDWLDFYRRLRKAIRNENPNAALMSNAAGAPLTDFSYWEFRRWHEHGEKSWKIIAHALATAKMFDRPGRFISPTPWHDEALKVNADPEYCNYLLSFGLCPSANTTHLERLKDKWAWVQAAWEMRGSSYSTALLDPAYLSRDDVEVHALQKPGEVLLAAIARSEDASDVEAALDAEDAGLQPDAPLFVWQMQMADPRDPEGVQEALDPRLVHVRPTGERPTVNIQSRYRLLNLYCITNCPAIVTQVGQQRLQGAQPTVPSVTMLPAWNGEVCTIELSAERECSIFIPNLPDTDGASAAVDGVQMEGQAATVGGVEGSSFTIDAGDHLLEVRWE